MRSGAGWSGRAGGAKSVEGEFSGVGDEARVAAYLRGEVVGEFFAELDHRPADLAAGVLGEPVGAQPVAGVTVPDVFAARDPEPVEELQGSIYRRESHFGVLSLDAVMNLFGGEEASALFEFPHDEPARAGQATSAAFERVLDLGCQSRPGLRRSAARRSARSTKSATARRRSSSAFAARRSFQRQYLSTRFIATLPQRGRAAAGLARSLRFRPRLDDPPREARRRAPVHGAPPFPIPVHQAPHPGILSELWLRAASTGIRSTKMCRASSRPTKRVCPPTSTSTGPSKGWRSVISTSEPRTMPVSAR